jgi:hypothetical protein
MTAGVAASGSNLDSTGPLTPDTRGIWKVITASSVGTMIEWYDFYIFGSLAAIISTQFFPSDSPTASFLKPSPLCGGLCRSTLRAGVRTNR